MINNSFKSNDFLSGQVSVPKSDYEEKKNNVDLDDFKINPSLNEKNYTLKIFRDILSISNSNKIDNLFTDNFFNIIRFIWINKFKDVFEMKEGYGKLFININLMALPVIKKIGDKIPSEKRSKGFFLLPRNDKTGMNFIESYQQQLSRAYNEYLIILDAEKNHDLMNFYKKEENSHLFFRTLSDFKLKQEMFDIQNRIQFLFGYADGSFESEVSDLYQKFLELKGKIKSKDEKMDELIRKVSVYVGIYKTRNYVENNIEIDQKKVNELYNLVKVGLTSKYSLTKFLAYNQFVLLESKYELFGLCNKNLNLIDELSAYQMYALEDKVNWNDDLVQVSIFSRAESESRCNLIAFLSRAFNNEIYEKNVNRQKHLFNVHLIFVYLIKFTRSLTKAKPQKNWKEEITVSERFLEDVYKYLIDFCIKFKKNDIRKEIENNYKYLYFN